MALRVKKKPKKKAAKKPAVVVDFGRLEDWRSRLNGCLIRYEGMPFYVTGVTEEYSKEYNSVHAELRKVQRKYSETPTLEGRREIQPEMDKLADKLDKLARTQSTVIIIVGRQVIPDESGKGYSLSKKKKLKKEDIDLSLYSLGFMNSSKSEVYYVTRVAGQSGMRHGIHPNNIRLLRPNTRSGDKKMKPASRGVELTSDNFLDIVFNKYPTLTECLDSLFPMEGQNQQAFHRDFAIQVDAIGHVTLLYRTKLVGSSPNEGESFKLVGRYGYLKESLEEIGVKIDT